MCSNCKNLTLPQISKLSDSVSEKYLQDVFEKNLELDFNQKNANKCIDSAGKFIYAIPLLINNFEYIRYTPLWTQKQHHTAIFDIVSALNASCATQFRVRKPFAQLTSFFDEYSNNESTSEDSGFSVSHSLSIDASMRLLSSNASEAASSAQRLSTGTLTDSLLESVFEMGEPPLLTQSSRSNESTTSARNAHVSSLSVSDASDTSGFSLRSSRHSSMLKIDPFERLWPGSGTFPLFLSSFSLELVHFVLSDHLDEPEIGSACAEQLPDPKSFSSEPASPMAGSDPPDTTCSNSVLGVESIPSSTLSQLQQELLHELLCNGRILEAGHAHGLLVPLLDVRYCRSGVKNLDVNLKRCSIVYTGNRLIIGDNVCIAMHEVIEVRQTLLHSGLKKLRYHLYQMSASKCARVLVSLIPIESDLLNRFYAFMQSLSQYDRASPLRGMYEFNKILSEGYEIERRLLLRFWYVSLLPVISRLVLRHYFRRAGFTPTQLQHMLERFKRHSRVNVGLSTRYVYRLWELYVTAFVERSTLALTPALSRVESSSRLASMSTSGASTPGFVSLFSRQLQRQSSIGIGGGAGHSPMSDQLDTPPMSLSNAVRELDAIDNLPTRIPYAAGENISQAVPEWLISVRERLFPEDAHWDTALELTRFLGYNLVNHSASVQAFSRSQSITNNRSNNVAASVPALSRSQSITNNRSNN